MNLVLLVVLVSIGLVSVESAWKENRIYTYKVHAKTRNNEGGAVLSIYPQSDILLIGQIHQALEYREPTSQLFQLPWNKQFLIHLANGVIQSISVDGTVSNDQINQLKSIVSLFQVDIRARNLIQSEDNRFLSEHNTNAFYRTMEPTFTGNCETIYDVTELPKYLAEAHPNWIPLPELKGDGDFIKIEKTRNFNNCKERSSYLDFDSKIRTDSQSHSSLNSKSDESIEQTNLMRSVTRVFLSGDLENYVIQSSNTTRDNEGSLDYLDVTLESVEEGCVRKMLRLESYVNVGSLVYTSNMVHRMYNSDDKDHNATYSRTIGHQMTNIQNSLRGASTCRKAAGAQEQWSGCWTAFPSASTICKSKFTAEWENIDSECCGFLCLGKRAKCRLSFPGCVSTVCYSAFIPHDTLCNDSFKEKYPVTCGGFDDCAPGFYGARCCPKSYE